MFNIAQPNSAILKQFNHTMHPLSPQPHLARPPTYRRCYTITVPHIVATNNRNGNTGRPCHICPNMHQRRFSTFADCRGLHLTNPVCECPGFPLSRVQVAGLNDDLAVPRSVFFSCAVGGCDFFAYHVDDRNPTQILRLHHGLL